MRKYLTTLILIALGFGAGLIAQGQVQILLAQPADRAVDAPSGETYAPNQLPAADLVFQRVPGPDMPSLQDTDRRIDHRRRGNGESRRLLSRQSGAAAGALA